MVEQAYAKMKLTGDDSSDDGGDHRSRARRSGALSLENDLEEPSFYKSLDA